jgi:hypothetical protein
MCTDLLCLHQRIFEKYYINTVRDVDLVCFAPDKKVWRAALNMVMCLQVVLEAGE